MSRLWRLIGQYALSQVVEDFFLRRSSNFLARMMAAVLYGGTVGSILNKKAWTWAMEVSGWTRWYIASRTNGCPNTSRSASWFPVADCVMTAMQLPPCRDGWFAKEVRGIVVRTPRDFSMMGKVTYEPRLTLYPLYHEPSSINRPIIFQVRRNPHLTISTLSPENQG